MADNSIERWACNFYTLKRECPTIDNPRKSAQILQLSEELKWSQGDHKPSTKMSKIKDRYFKC